MLRIEDYYPIDILELKKRWNEKFGELNVAWDRLQLDMILKLINDQSSNIGLRYFHLQCLPYAMIEILDNMKKEKEERKFILGQKVLYVNPAISENDKSIIRHQGIVVEILEDGMYKVEFDYYFDSPFVPSLTKRYSCHWMDLYPIER